MKFSSERVKKGLVLAVTLALGFAGGFLTKELSDLRNAATASETSKITVYSMEDKWAPSFDSLLPKDFWRMEMEPFLSSFDVNKDMPSLRTVDGEHELKIIAQVPGMDENDVKVEAKDRSLIIKGQKKREERKDGRFEKIDQSFQQSVHLPAKVDSGKMQTAIKDGVLTVTLPKI